MDGMVLEFPQCVRNNVKCFTMWKLRQKYSTIWKSKYNIFHKCANFIAKVFDDDTNTSLLLHTVNLCT